MPLMDAYVPGTFCWTDLGTPDTAGARRFYTALFGWSADDRPAGPGAVYTVLLREGRSVAALYAQDQGASGGRPHWLSYVAVAGAAESAERARALGGTVVVDPFDVLDVGRMAVVQDPDGAVLALWEGRRHAGAAIVGEPDTMCWNELVTTRPDLAREFYGGLFGWTAGGGTSPRTTFVGQGAARAGLRTVHPPDGSAPPHWLVYFGVRDCDGQAALVQSLGGRVREQTDAVPGAGRCAVFDDPQGATFAVLTPGSADVGGPR